MQFSESVLVDSRTARDESLSVITAHEVQQETLIKVKPVFFALWRGCGYMTTKQVAGYYGVLENTIRQNHTRCKSEFDADGVVKVQGDDLKEVRDIMSLSSFTPQIVLYPPRAVIRMGFILQESEAAAQVRTAALNVIQGVGKLFSEEALHSLIAGNPPCQAFVENSRLKTSTPLGSYYDAIERKLRATYATGGIPGLTKDQIRDQLALLSTFTGGWKLGTQTEMRFRLKGIHSKYPDLTSPIIPVNVDGRQETAIFMFQVENLMIEPKHVEDCIGRQYVRRAKDHFGVDHAYLLLVAPFGANPDAEEYIQKQLPEEMKGFFGVVTVKELAQFLRHRANEERRSNLVKGEIRTNFKQILDYRIPDDPLTLLMGVTFASP